MTARINVLVALSSKKKIIQEVTHHSPNSLSPCRIPQQFLCTSSSIREDDIVLSAKKKKKSNKTPYWIERSRSFRHTNVITLIPVVPPNSAPR